MCLNHFWLLTQPGLVHHINIKHWNKQQKWSSRLTTKHCNKLLAIITKMTEWILPIAIRLMSSTNTRHSHHPSIVCSAVLCTLYIHGCNSQQWEISITTLKSDAAPWRAPLTDKISSLADFYERHNHLLLFENETEVQIDVLSLSKKNHLHPCRHQKEERWSRLSLPCAPQRFLGINIKRADILIWTPGRRKEKNLFCTTWGQRLLFSTCRWTM